MSAIYRLCEGTDGCLVSVLDILSVLPANKKFTPEKVENVLNELHYDGYFDLISSMRKGEKTFVITLKESGLAFKRTAKQKQRDVAFKIFLAFIGAVATFIFGLILNALS
ncbi:MAG: hypothetical protein J6B04_00955 [Clostridia bacterium]|nr:hypothetical protein [Clostridia bacterium]